MPLTPQVTLFFCLKPSCIHTAAVIYSTSFLSTAQGTHPSSHLHRAAPSPLPGLSPQQHKSLLSVLGLLFGLDTPQALLGERWHVTVCHRGWFVARWPRPEAALAPAAQVELLIPG